MRGGLQFRVLVLSSLLFFSSRRRHTRCLSDWSSDVCSSDLSAPEYQAQQYEGASTLLGPGQAAGLARLLVLAAAGRGDPPAGNTVPARTFLAGPLRKNPFGPETLLVRRRRNMVDEDLEPLLPRRLRRLEARIPRFDWD